MATAAPAKKAAPVKRAPSRYNPKPTPAKGLPKWFLDIRAGSDFMPMNIKPVSYNYMADIEAIHRSTNYGTSNKKWQYVDPSPTPTAAAAAIPNSQYWNTPTKEVTEKINTNSNLIQDVWNLGGKVKDRFLGGFMSFVDNISRPRYAIMNQYSAKLDTYKSPDSAGGTEITWGEHIQAFWKQNSPVGGLVNLATASDKQKEAEAAGVVKGLTLKQKTSGGEIIGKQFPGFSKEHPKGASWAGVGADLVFDPLNYLVVAAAPGTLTKGGLAATSLLFGSKSGAKSLLSETLFTGAGREAAANAARTAVSKSELRKIVKPTKALNRDARRAAGQRVRGSTKVKYADDVRQTMIDDIAAKASAQAKVDLTGAQLSRKLAVRAFKTGGLDLLFGAGGRYYLGANAGGSALGAARTIAEVSDLHDAAVASSLANEDRWMGFYAINKGKDITYTHNGKPYTIKLDDVEDGNILEYMKRIVREASPVAKYGEFSTKAARARKGKIVSVENRARSLISHMDKEFAKFHHQALDTESGKAYDTAAAYHAIPRSSTIIEDGHKDLQPNSPVLKIDEDDLNALNIEDLKKQAFEYHAAKHPKGAKSWSDSKGRVTIQMNDGSKRSIKISTLEEAAKVSKARRTGELDALTRAASRSEAVKGEDAAAGLADDVITTREKFIGKYDEFAQARAAAEATRGASAEERLNGLVDAIKSQRSAEEIAARLRVGLSPKSNGYVEAIFGLIHNSGEFTEADQLDLLGILANESIPLVDRIEQVLRDPRVPTDIAQDAVKKVFRDPNVRKGEVQASALGQGQGMKMAVQKIMRAVLKDRWDARLADMADVAGVEMSENAKWLNLIQKEKEMGSPAYTRDVAFEVGMAIMDATRASVEWAVREQLLKDPKNLVAAIKETTDEFINGASADLKMQVMNYMFNMLGVRLPEEFVPTHAVVDKFFDDVPEIFGQLGKSGTKNPMQQLALAAQHWAINDLHFITPVKHNDIAKTGWNLEKFGKEVTAWARKRKGISLESYHGTVKPLREKIDLLHAKTAAAPINGTVGAVNRYKMLDFLLHGKEILESQTTTLVVKGREGGGVVGRLNAGRLSALDSFTFVDEEAKAGLEAIEQLKKLASAKNTNGGERLAAQRELARLYEEHGIHDYLASLDTGGKTLDTVDLRPLFKNLGTHARLKEEAVTEGSSFGPKWREVIMDSMWGTPTMTHEWQKALQHKILGLTLLDGNRVPRAAELIQKNLDEMFATHDRIRELIYPVNKSGKLTDELGNKVTGPTERSAAWMNTRAEGVQEAWGPNPFNVRRNKPFLEDEVTTTHTLPDGEHLDWGTVRVAEYRGNIPRNVDPSRVKIEPRFMFTVPDATTGTPRNIGMLRINRQNPMISKMEFVVYKLDGVTPLRTVSLGSTRGSTINDVAAAKNAVRNKFTVERLERMKYENRYPGNAYAENAVLKPGVKTVEGRSVNNPELKGDLNAAAKAVEADSTALNARKATAEAEQQYLNNMEAPAASDVTDVKGAELDAAAVEYARAEKAAKDAEATEAAPVANNVKNKEEGDFANLMSPGFKYTPEETAAIKAWIAETYSTHTPEELGRALHASSTAMTADLVVAQARIITDLQHFNIKHGASVKVMGAPIMKMINPMNATHANAGLTVLEQSRSFAAKFWGDRFNPLKVNTEKRRKFLMKIKKRSHVLEQTLDQIRMRIANAASQMQRTIIDRVNILAGGVGKAELKNTSVNAMGRRARFRHANKKFFGPLTPGDLKEFETVAGENFLEEVESDLLMLATRVFKTNHQTTNLETFKLMNKYMVNGYEFDNLSMIAIEKAYDSGRLAADDLPYTREWFVKVADILTSNNLKSKYSADEIMDMNLATLHYGIHNAELKLDAGRETYTGAWREFGVHMDDATAQTYNETLVPHSEDIHGKPMRGKMVKVRDLVDDGRVQSRFVPKDFLDPMADPFYIPEDFVPELNILFEFMDMTHHLNDVINVGFLNKITNNFKASVTIWNIPAYPVNNAIGDIFMSAMQGLVNPRFYQDSASILRETSDTLKTMQPKDFKGMLDESWMKDEFVRAQHDPESVFNPAKPGNPTRLVLHFIGGSKQELSAPEIVAAYNELGLGLNRVSQDIGESVAGARRNEWSAKLGKFGDGVRKLNDVREDWTRMAHFLYALEKYSPQVGNIQDALRMAGDEVIKTHFDYTDVSWFERKAVAPFIPFYKWMRNIAPYTITQMLTKPIYINAEQAASQMWGVALNDDINDQHKDLVIPEYMARENPVPIGLWSDPNGNQFQQFAAMKLPLTQSFLSMIAPIVDPVLDPNIEGPRAKAAGATSGVAQVLGSRFGPVGTVVTQAMTGQEVWPTGPQEAKGDIFDALMNSIPGSAPLQSAGKTIGSVAGADKGTGKNLAAELGNFFGINRVMTNSEKGQLGELNRLEDKRRAQTKILKAKLAAELMKAQPGIPEADAALIVDQYTKQMRVPNG